MDSPDSPSTFLLLFGFLGGMCGLGAVIAMIVYLGGYALASLGWRDLAKVYPAGEHPPEGVVVRGCGASVGMNTYKGSLTVTFAREGIHVASGSWSGRAGSHPPILLPWSGVKRATKKETRFSRYGIIEFQDGENWTMTLIVPSPEGQDLYTAHGWNEFAGP